MKHRPRALLLRPGFWLRGFWLAVGFFHLYLFLRRIAADGWGDPTGQIKLILTLAGSLYAAAFSFKVEKWAASISASPRKAVALGLVLLLAHIDPARLGGPRDLPLAAADFGAAQAMLLVPALAGLGLLGLAMAARRRGNLRPVRMANYCATAPAAEPRAFFEIPPQLYRRPPPAR